MRVRVPRLLPGLGSLFLPLCLLTAAPQNPPAESDGAQFFGSSVQPFLSTNCSACHNAHLQSGNLNVDTFRSPDAAITNRDSWEKILAKLKAGEMPPPGAPRPAKAEVNAVASWIEGEFDRADRQTKPNPGRVTARRLNRSEYNNTVRDLLGVAFRPADDFPQDDTSFGFDTIGDVLSLPPLLMERYMAAAEKIARVALRGPESIKPTVERHYPYRYRPSEHPFLGKYGYTLTNYDLSGLTMPTSYHTMHRFPLDAEYSIRVTGDGVRPGGSDPIEIAFWIDGEQQAVRGQYSNKILEGGNILLEGQTAELRVRIPAGDHWIATSFLRQFEGLPAAYGALNPSKNPLPEPPQREFRPPPNATPEEIAELEKQRAERAARPRRLQSPDLFRVRFLEISGPFEPATRPSPEGLEKIYTCGHLEGGHQPGCGRAIVADLARRAYRRPVHQSEVDRLMSLVSRAERRGEPLEAGIELAIRALLVSPHFLFRIENDAGPAKGKAAVPMSEVELASRLSYFLWSSMPDDELLRLAEDKKLRDAGVLEAQVRRMLQDPKSRALVTDFGGQWLHFRALESVKPDPIKFERWEEYLRLSMRQETELFFQHIIREDRSVLDFLDADYTFLNERLAHHYGISGVQGPQFRKVDLSGTPRRGVLTQASVLTVSSYANRTSPVLRGKWILENMLNAPPPPPPPDVPVLDEATVASAASLREQMEKHRENAACASCHARMDPLGFGLENFNAIGAWRSQEGDAAIDASGVLPDGTSFDGPLQLAEILKADKDSFAESITTKMLTYALGRGLSRADRLAVRTVSDGLAASDYKFSSLVLGIVNSTPFQMRSEDQRTP